jgi:hypothetical protein
MRVWCDSCSSTAPIRESRTLTSARQVRDHYVSTVCVATFGVLLAVLPLALRRPILALAACRVRRTPPPAHRSTISDEDGQQPHMSRAAGMRRTRKRVSTTRRPPPRPTEPYSMRTPPQDPHEEQATDVVQHLDAWMELRVKCEKTTLWRHTARRTALEDVVCNVSSTAFPTFRDILMV